MKYTGTFWHSYSYRFFCQQPVTEREHTYIPAKKSFIVPLHLLFLYYSYIRCEFWAASQPSQISFPALSQRIHIVTGLYK